MTSCAYCAAGQSRKPSGAKIAGWRDRDGAEAIPIPPKLGGKLQCDANAHLSLARRALPPTYRGGNGELGTGATRLAVGAFAVNPMTAQLMSTPTEPYGAPLGPVTRSGRVAARLKTTFSSICHLSSPAVMAFWVHWPSCASRKHVDRVDEPEPARHCVAHIAQNREG
jgi:hypothetical protein